ncbi:MAG: hypothetical protein GY841_04610 [FCB group bacterium]|nr:hypothetical protein [FCB group bacterium]
MYKPPKGMINLIYRNKQRHISVYGDCTAECDKILNEILTSPKVVAGVMKDVKDDDTPLVKLGPGGDYVKEYK